MNYESAIERWKADMGEGGWVGVDLDGTLARYDGWHGPHHIGAPIPVMVRRVKKMLEAKVDVRIFTARVCDPTPGVVEAVQAWCQEHLGVVLAVTNVKDYHTMEIWDDRAVQVVPNTGRRADGRR